MDTDKIFPDNWKEVIRGKKVILYNTGVSSLLGGKEKRIEKMKWVFQVFTEHPEVVLWWRPHPLELSTLKSMLPELEADYKKVRQKYIDEYIGILDESVDLDRAIVISDAYYGAYSSVVELYKAVKKPVLYENGQIKMREPALFLPYAICVKNNMLWFTQAHSNKLVKVNGETYDVEGIISLPMMEPFKWRSENDFIIATGNSLLLILQKSKNIYEYEISTEHIKIHPIKIDNFRINHSIAMEWKGKLLMFPYNGRDILQYDYHTDTATIIAHMGFQNIKLARCYEIVGEKIYMVNSGSEYVYEFDLVSQLCEKRSVGDKKNKYWGIKKAGKYFVLPHLDKTVITLWEEDSNNIIELTEFPDQYRYLEGEAYLDMFEKNGSLYIFPLYGNMILKVDVDNKVVSQAFPEVFFPSGDDVNSKTCDNAYLSVKRYGNIVYTYAEYKKCLQVFDLDTMSLQNIPLSEVETEEYKEMLDIILDNDVYEESFCESENFTERRLENYIVNVQKSRFRMGEHGRILNSIGQDIYMQMLCI